MNSIRTLLSSMAALVLLLPVPGPAMAQRPSWTPIAELLLGSLGEADPARMSDVMSRCTALNMLFAALAADFSAEMSQDYQQKAHQLIEHGVLIESSMEEERTGQNADLDKLSGIVIERVRGMLQGYSAWLDDNRTQEGFSINQEIELEMESCKLALKLMTHMAAE